MDKSVTITYDTPKEERKKTIPQTRISNVKLVTFENIVRITVTWKHENDRIGLTTRICKSIEFNE